MASNCENLLQQIANQNDTIISSLNTIRIHSSNTASRINSLKTTATSTDGNTELSAIYTKELRDFFKTGDGDKQLEVLNRLLELVGGTRYE